MLSIGIMCHDECMVLYPVGKLSYSPKATEVAIIGHPFTFDFKFTGAASPHFYRWFKNGRVFRGVKGRVTLDHTGIKFSRVLQEDAGHYQITARIRGRDIRARSTLKGKLLFKSCTVLCCS